MNKGLLKKTKIVATVGPACQKEDTLKKMIAEGVDLFRINSSHTSLQTLKEWVAFIRKVTDRLDKKVAILVDLQGPRVRTGSLINSKPVMLRKGQRLKIVAGPGSGSSEQITTRCLPFPKMVKKGDPILLDNGILELQVESVKGKEVFCRVIVGGKLGENKGINLPNAPTTLPALSQADRKVVKLSAQLNVDFIALSFVRNASDLKSLQKLLKSLRKDIPIVAKIEKPQAVDNLDEILDAVGGVMVARGDLGIEMGVEKVPVIQKEIAQRANEAGVPVITATQMLESMMELSHPTRAEVSDIANAVFDGTDAVMLSGETSVGKYPLQAVRTMAKILIDADTHMKRDSSYASGRLKNSEVTPAFVIAHAAQAATLELDAKGIIAYTLSGQTAYFMSKLKPEVPIFAISSTEAVSRRLSILRGVIPMTLLYGIDANRTLKQTDKMILKYRLLKKGDPVVIVTGKQAIPDARFMTKIHLFGSH